MNMLIQISQKKAARMALLGLAVLALPLAAHAQSGCTDSPENPTVVLALVGSAGAFFANARRRISVRRSTKKK
jgi:XrtJ-associated TM-motif-TM protein